MMQLLDNLNRFGNKQSTTHYISLLAESYRKESRTNRHHRSNSDLTSAI
jgi:hypothetical protein